MDRRFLAILAAVVVIFLGIFIFSQHSNKSGGGSTNSNGAQATNHVEGQGQKGVTLIEYGDYECPICKEFYQPLKDVAAQFNKDIYFQFRDLPLSEIHKNAYAAARAAEAAGLQGTDKFWAMHDKLYENQDPNGASGWVASSDPLNQYFVNFASAIGLNVSQFKTDYVSQKVNDAINADVAAFDQTGQQKATPTLFLDGQYIDNSQLIDKSTGTVSASTITSLVQAEIAKKHPGQ